jgi:hypothetical protein
MLDLYSPAQQLGWRQDDYNHMLMCCAQYYAALLHTYVAAGQICWRTLC